MLAYVPVWRFVFMLKYNFFFIFSMCSVYLVLVVYVSRFRTAVKVSIDAWFSRCIVGFSRKQTSQIILFQKFSSTLPEKKVHPLLASEG